MISQQGVRVVLVTAYPLKDLSNTEKRHEWIKNLTSSAIENHADGVNIDIEGPIKKGSKEVALLSQLTADVYRAFKEELPGSQVDHGLDDGIKCRVLKMLLKLRMHRFYSI